ncbi:MAG: hypothetical protein WCP85_23380, partial [Mariniphaga sp.]
WASQIDELLKDTTFHLLLTVRDNFTDRIIQKWNLNSYNLLIIPEMDDGKIGDFIKEQLLGNEND